MENQADSKQIIINYGLITGGAAIIITLISYSLGKAANPGPIFATLSFIIPFTLIVLGIRQYKKSNQNMLAWLQAVKVGIGIALIWGILALSFQYILENIIAPELIDEKIELIRENLENWGVDDDAIDQQIEKQRNLNPFFGNAMGLLLFIFLGFIVSAISGAIMKKTEEDTY